MDLIKKARNFAILKHKDQKYNSEPYVYHLDMVFKIVKKWQLPIQYQIAAYLHDIIEDTGTTKEEIAKEFGEEVSDLVYSVSGEGNSRKERKVDTLQKLTNHPNGIPLKMADRFVNMSESKKNNFKLYSMYKKELKDYEFLFSKYPQYLKNFEEFSMDLPKKKFKV